MKLTYCLEKILSSSYGDVVIIYPCNNESISIYCNPNIALKTVDMQRLCDMRHEDHCYDAILL